MQKLNIAQTYEFVRNKRLLEANIWLLTYTSKEYIESLYQLVQYPYNCEDVLKKSKTLNEILKRSTKIVSATTGLSDMINMLEMPAAVVQEKLYISESTYSRKKQLIKQAYNLNINNFLLISDMSIITTDNKFDFMGLSKMYLQGNEFLLNAIYKLRNKISKGQYNELRRTLSKTGYADSNSFEKLLILLFGYDALLYKYNLTIKLLD